MTKEMLDYNETVYKELERKGLTRKDTDTIMKIADFSLVKYPEIMDDPADKQADRLIVVAAILLQVQRHTSVPNEEKAELLDRLIRCIRSAGLTEQYNESREQMRSVG